MKRSDFKHFHNEAVRWGDCDMLAHVNNTCYLRYIESARIDYFLRLLDLKLSTENTSGWVLADLSCSFKEQLKYPCSLVVGSRFSKVGNSSATLLAAIFKEGIDAPCFTSTAILVWYDHTAKSSKRIPDTVRSQIKNHEGSCDGL